MMVPSQLQTESFLVRETNSYHSSSGQFQVIEFASLGSADDDNAGAF